MSEEKKTRTRQDIQQEYSQLCAKAGNLQYQIWAFNKDLENLYSAARDLNQEAAELDANARAEKAAQEPAKETA